MLVDVGGWTNPFEEYARQSQGPGDNGKKIRNDQLDFSWKEKLYTPEV